MRKLCEFTMKLFVIYAMTALWLYIGYVCCKPIVARLVTDRIVMCKCEVQLWPTVEQVNQAEQ